MAKQATPHCIASNCLIKQNFTTNYFAVFEFVRPESLSALLIRFPA